MPRMSDERFRKFEWEPRLWTVVLLYSGEGKQDRGYQIARFGGNRKGRTSLTERNIEFWDDNGASLLTQDQTKKILMQHAGLKRNQGLKRAHSND